jgi:hypothetical protein
LSAAAELARRAGEQSVAGIDPAPGFAAACQERLPSADIREGIAEELPWDDGRHRRRMHVGFRRWSAKLPSAGHFTDALVGVGHERAAGLAQPRLAVGVELGEVGAGGRGRPRG